MKKRWIRVGLAVLGFAVSGCQNNKDAAEPTYVSELQRDPGKARQAVEKMNRGVERSEQAAHEVDLN